MYIYIFLFTAEGQCRLQASRGPRRYSQAVYSPCMGLAHVRGVRAGFIKGLRSPSCRPGRSSVGPGMVEFDMSPESPGASDPITTLSGLQALRRHRQQTGNAIGISMQCACLVLSPCVGPARTEQAGCVVELCSNARVCIPCLQPLACLRYNITVLIEAPVAAMHWVRSGEPPATLRQALRSDSKASTIGCTLVEF